MSHRTVQFIIGRLLTDEELRLRFVRDPRETLTALRDQGFELTNGEVDALAQIDRTFWLQAADRMHPRLQRCRLCRE